MKTTELDTLPEEIKKQVIEARKNHQLASKVDQWITDHFAVCDLQVAASKESITISGMVDSKKERESIELLVRKSMELGEIDNELVVAENKTDFIVEANNETHKISTLKELEAIFRKHKVVDFMEYHVTDHQETSLLLLRNQTHSMAMYLRFYGDSGFTTMNPDGEEEKSQNFLLSNGQMDCYSEDMLVEKSQGYDILRYYLLTGEMHPSIHWKEE